MKNIEDKTIGSIVGHAIGDALGMPIEGINPHYRKQLPRTLSQFYNPLPGALTQDLKAGQFTDDTQLLIATAEGLLEAKKYDPRTIAKKYIDLKGKNKETMSLRAPGWTTIFGIDKLRKKIIDTQNTPWNYAECGRPTEGGCAAMNRAIGYILFSGENYNPEEAKELTFMTHRSPEAWANVEAVKTITDYLRSNTLDSQEDAYPLIERLNENNSVYRHIGKAVQHLGDNIWNGNAYRTNEFGASGKGSVVLLNALNSFLTAPTDFRAGVERAVDNYDPDSVGALTGYFAGLNNGFSQIDPAFMQELEDIDRLYMLGSDLSAEYQLNDSKHSAGR